MRLRPPPNVLPELVADDEDSPILAYFAMALRSERVKAGLTTSELARRLGQRRTTVTCWETGRGIPRFTNLMRLLAMFPALGDALNDLAAQLSKIDKEAS